MEKSIKTKKKNKINYSTGEQAEVKNFIIVIIVVLLCVVGIYFLTRIFVTKDLFTHESPKQEDTLPVEVNYDVAMVGTIMNRPYDEYYVAVYDTTGKNNYDMASIVSTYKGKKKLHIYRVDLNEHLNKEYYKPEEVNTKATGVEDFKFGDVTLLRIKKGKITKYITEIDAIKKELDIQ